MLTLRAISVKFWFMLLLLLQQRDVQEAVDAPRVLAVSSGLATPPIVFTVIAQNKCLARAEP